MDSQERTATVLDSRAWMLNPGDQLLLSNGQTSKIRRIRQHETNPTQFYVDTDSGTTLMHRDHKVRLSPGNQRQQLLPGYGIPGGNTNRLPMHNYLPGVQGPARSIGDTTSGGSAPTCPVCGRRMVRRGNTFVCPVDGNTISQNQASGGSGAFTDAPRILHPRAHASMNNTSATPANTKENDRMTDDKSTRSDLVNALARAGSLADRQRAAAELDRFDQQAREAMNHRHDLDLAREDVASAMALNPASHTAATAASTESDWLAGVAAGPGAKQARAEIIAEAGAWFERCDDLVKAHPDEFAIQAQGHLARFASKYLDAESALNEGLHYVSFLWRQAASGLPQVQQTVSPLEQPAPTPLPVDVFDNFAPAVDPVNDQAVGNDSSQRSPQLQELQSNQGQGQAEWPSQHTEGDDPQVAARDQMLDAAAPTAQDAALFTQGSFLPAIDPVGTPTLANNTVHTLPEVLAKLDRQAASGLPQVQQTVSPLEQPGTTPLPVDVAFPWEMGTPQQAQQQAQDAQQAASDEQDDEEGDDDPNRRQAAHQRSDAWLSGYHTGHGDVQRSHGSRRGGVSNPYLYGTDSHAGWSVGAGEAREGTAPHHPRPSWDDEDNFEFHDDDDPSLLGPLGRDAEYHYVKPDPDGHGYVVTQKGTGKVLSHHDTKEDAEASFRAMMAQKHGSQRTADMWGASDLPHQVALPDVANSARTVPAPQSGVNYQRGQSDAQDPSQRPDYMDNSSAVPQSVKDYTEGYSDALQAGVPQGDGKNEPYSLIGDGEPVLDATVRGRVSYLFTDPETANNPDFVKGYRFACKWRSGQRLASVGSPEFEAGLYAGIADHREKHESWRAAHRRVGSQSLTDRIASNDAYTDYLAEAGIDVTAAQVKTAADDDSDDAMRAIQDRDPDGWEFNIPTNDDRDAHHQWAVQTYGPRAWKRYIDHAWDYNGSDRYATRRQAATSTDLDTMSNNASPSPTGQTPINGPGTVPPLAGGTNPAAAGGPSPYNGAPPFGAGVVPHNTQQPLPATNAPTVNDLPGGPVDTNTTLDSGERLATFRKRVQASLLQRNTTSKGA